MITTSNFQSIRILRNWCMLTLPTVFNDALSYNEQVCKLTEALNQQGEIIKGLPEYIEQIVKELLEQAGLEDIVKQVLADYFFINVKNPPAPLAPAIGDGVADDTVAIQAMINYVAGKPNYLFFPAGTYSVQGLTMVDGVSLIGLDRFKTILMLRSASNKDLLTGDLGNCTIANIMLNANMPGQTANCSVYSGNVNDMMIGNVIFKNGYNMLSLNVDGTVQIDNVVFDGVQGNGLSLGGTKTMINNIEFVRNSALNAGTLLTISGGNNMVTSLLNTEFANNGVVLNGNDNIVEGWVSGTTTPLTDTGTGNKVSLYTGADKIVKTGNLIESETGNRTIDVGGQVKETITGSETKSIGGSYTEVLIGSHSVTAGEDYIAVGHNVNLTASASVDVGGQDVVLNPTNPLTYKAPTVLNPAFNTVPFKNAGTVYNVLVQGTDLDNAIFYTPKQGADITTELNQLLTQKTVVLAPGDYVISNTIVIPIEHALIGNNTTLTVSSAFTAPYMVQIGLVSPPAPNSDCTYLPNKNMLYGVNLNCNLKCSGILVLTRGAEIHYSKITLPIVTGTGIDVFAYGVTPVISADCYIEYCKVCNNDKGNAEPNPTTLFAYGIRTNGSDNYIYGFRTFGSKCGIWCSAYSGGTTITDSHVLCCNSTDTGWVGSIGYDTSLSTSITLTNCYADNFNTGVILYMNSCVTNFFYYAWETGNDTMRKAIIIKNTNNSVMGVVSFAGKTIMLDVAKEYPFQTTNLISVGQYPYHVTFDPADDIWKMFLRQINSYMVVPTTNKFVFAISSLFGGQAPNPLNVLSDHCNLTGFNLGTNEVTWGECTYNGAIVEILLKPGTNIRYITLELPGYTPVPNEGFAVTSPFPYSWLIVPRECSNLSTAGFTSEGSHTYTNTPATV